MRISIYGHSGSYKHRNEAVIRGISNILDERLTLNCTDPYADRIFELNDIVDIVPEGGESSSFVERNIAKIGS